MSIGGRGIQSIEIGGRLLLALAERVKPMMLRDLAEAAGMPSAQAHAYLVSFRKLELVEQDVATGRYRLGPFALHLGLARLRASEPYQIAADAVVSLVDRLDLAATISVWGTYGATVVRIQESSHQIHANVRPGTVFGLTNTATGRLFAAFLPERLVDPLIHAELRDPARRSQGAPASLAALRAELAEVRRRGLATAHDMPVPGISALSAPIFDHSGQMQVAVTVMGPTQIVDCAEGGPHWRALDDFTRDLSVRLGHRPAA